MELSQERLARVLNGRAFQYFAVLDSTNDQAQAWLREGAPNGALVIADEQRKGRGRKGRVWHTPPGVALAISFILRPPQTALHQVSMLGALAVSDLLTEIGARDVGVKWPNDVQLGGRKVCGILPEVIWNGDHLLGVVLGIGVNVRVDFSGTELERVAISIEHALSKTFDRADLVARLVARFDHWTVLLGSDAMFKVWKSRLNMLGKSVIVEQEGVRLTGTAEDVDADGGLHLRRPDGALERVLAGDVLPL